MTDSRIEKRSRGRDEEEDGMGGHMVRTERRSTLAGKTRNDGRVRNI